MVEDVQQVLADMGLAGLADAAPQWRQVDSWTSFFARFVRVAASGRQDLVLKFGSGWSEADVAYVAEEIARVHDLGQDLPGGAVLVPPVIGVAPSRGAIAMDYISSVPFFEALADPLSSVRTDLGLAGRLARNAGELVGAFHASEPVPDNAATAKLALDDLQKAAKRAGYRAADVLRHEPELARARGYRLSHNDYLLNEGGLVVVDPPHVRKYDYVHRDLSAFTLALHRSFHGERWVEPGTTDRAEVDQLCEAFLEGYSQTSTNGFGDDLDMWILRLFELSRIGSQLSGRVRKRATKPAAAELPYWVRFRLWLGRSPRK